MTYYLVMFMVTMQVPLTFVIVPIEEKSAVKSYLSEAACRADGAALAARLGNQQPPSSHRYAWACVPL